MVVVGVDGGGMVAFRTYFSMSPDGGALQGSDAICCRLIDIRLGVVVVSVMQSGVVERVEEATLYLMRILTVLACPCTHAP